MPSNNRLISTEDYMMRKIRRFMLDNIHNNVLNLKLASFLQASFDVEILDQDDADKLLTESESENVGHSTLCAAIASFLPTCTGSEASDLATKCIDLINLKFSSDDTSDCCKLRSKRKIRDAPNILASLLRLNLIRDADHLVETVNRI